MVCSDKQPVEGKANSTRSPGRAGRLLKRFGLVGFWFFMLKGLAWLGAATLVYFGLID